MGRDPPLRARAGRGGGDRPGGCRGPDRRAPDRTPRSRGLKVLLDTNVLVSALIAGGPPRRVLELVRAGHIELVLPDPVVEELLRVLGRKFHWDRPRLAELARRLDALATSRPTAPSRTERVIGDPEDDLILACAVSARVDVLVSGSRRHLLPLGAHRGVRILTPQALLAELRRQA